jgi:AcrR family transcriptional regulator
MAAAGIAAVGWTRPEGTEGRQDRRPPRKKGEALARSDKKGLLLEAAREVFSRKNFHDATIADITGEAGVGKGTFYLYFANKEELFREVVKDGVRRLRRALGASLEGVDDPEERVRRAVPVIFEFCRAEAGLYLVIFRETALIEMQDPGKYDAFYQPLVRDFMGVIEEGIRRGDFAVRNPEVVAYGMIGLMSSLIYHWLLTEARGDTPPGYPEEMVETLADFCCRGLVGISLPRRGNPGEKDRALLRRQLAELEERRRELERLERSYRKLLG